MSDQSVPPSAPRVLFGACDRHNLGDLLLAQVAARDVAPRPSLFAGLRAAAGWGGGMRVQPLANLVAQWPQRYGDAPLELLHVGGEVLDTDAWQVAVMLLGRREAAACIAACERNEAAREQWAATYLGTTQRAPYLVASGWRDGVRVVSEFRALGGVGLAARSAAFCAEVAATLGTAGALTVRDRVTQMALAAMGIDAGLVPDPVAGAGDWLTELAAAAPAPAGPYLAVQFAASFGDDATLAELAHALDACRLPVVLFAAGTAPWHDDFAVCRRLAAGLSVPVRVAETESVEELCALIGGARASLASSLHALLVAAALGVPRLALEARAGEARKLRAYADTWNSFPMATIVPGSRGLATIIRSQLAL